MPTYDVTILVVVVVCSEPILSVLFCFFTVDVSGTRQNIKKRSTAFIHVFHAPSYEKIKI